MSQNVRFINIEYVFNRIFDIYLWIKYFILFTLLGTKPEDYLAAHSGEEYDGLRDRFGLSDPFSSSQLGSAYGPNMGISSHTTDKGFFAKLASLFGGGNDTAAVASATGADGGGVFYHLISMMRDLMTIAALILISVLIYSSIRWKEIVNEYNAKFKNSHTPKLKPEEQAFILEGKTPSRLDIIENYMKSNDEAQWRLAILEADSMLAELLKTLPIAGVDVGEKLTNANKKSFQSLEDAWEAHKVRNKIAHEGSNFILTEKLARDTIKRFKNVFTEFNFGA